jgi:uncharacterized SAM-binding protein YcdF (DUF218 family)
VNPLKQFIIPVTEPVGMVWALMVCGLGFLAYKRNWTGVAVISLPVALLFVLGSTSLVDRLVGAAERPYAREFAAQSNAFNCVIVLGGGHSVSRFDPHGFTVSEAGDRYLAGGDLIRKGIAQVLILGGSAESLSNPGVPEAIPVQRWLESTGLNQITITNLGVCRDTRDEAVAAKSLLSSHGWTNAVLVTSALHMARSEAIFRKNGIAVIPCACDFQSYGIERRNSFSVFPRQERLRLLALFLHEQIGWAVYRLRGWI